MNTIAVELLLTLFLFIAIGAYIKGRTSNIHWLISLGRRSSVLLAVLIIVYNLVSINNISR